jgi:hypothetical protein
MQNNNSQITRKNSQNTKYKFSKYKKQIPKIQNNNSQNYKIIFPNYIIIPKFLEE